MKLLKIDFLLALILMNSSLLFSQEHHYRIKHITIEDGLSQNSPNGIIQDRKGFIWIGTEDGLNKYDGYRFRIYHHDPQNDQSLSDNYIYCLYEDRAGFIWIGTRNGGLSRFNPTLGTFKNYLYHGDDETTLSCNAVKCITEDQSGHIWIGTEHGLNSLDPKTNLITHYLHDPLDSYSISNDVIWSLEEDYSGNLWIGTNKGLNRFDPETGQFQVYLHDMNDPYSISDNVVMALHKGDTDVMWVGTKDGGLNHFDISSSLFTRFSHDDGKSKSLSSNWIRAIEVVDSTTLWVATYGGGLNRMDISKGTFTVYQNDPMDPFSLSDNDLYSIIQDQSGILWVGTNTGGINMMMPTVKNFQNFYYESKNPYSLSSNVIWSIYQDRSGIFWVGTAKGLNRYNPQTGKFSVVQIKPFSRNNTDYSDIRTITEDEEGYLWIGSYADGLTKLEPKTMKYENYKHSIDQLNPNIVRKILLDSRGNLWVGTAGGLNIFDRSSKKFHLYINDPDDPESLPHNFILDIYESRNGQIWISTWGGGVCIYNWETGKFKCHKPDIRDPCKLSNGVVWCVAQDPSGIFWLGTSLGLSKYDPFTGEFSNWTVKDGLPNNTVYAILVDAESDSNGNLVQVDLWLSTNYGLSHFDVETQSFRNYDVNDGLQSNEFNAGAFFKDKSGKMYFGGINGFTSFYPDEIKDDTCIPPVILTAFEIFNKPINVGEEVNGRVLLKKSITNLDMLELTYQENVFSFEFAALYFASPEKNKYAYKMEGFDEEWNYVDNQHSASYMNLSPGKYTFRVKGSNSDGIWNQEGTSIQIKIAPPFWETLWFRVLAFAFGILLVIAVYQYRIRTLHLRQVELEKTVNERTAELQDITRELTRANTDLKDFAYIISHDLKAPLRGVNQLVTWLSKDYENIFNEDGKNKIRLLKSRVLRMANLIDGVLRYTKAGHPGDNKREIDLKRLIRDIIESLAPPAHIQVEVQDEMPTIFSHPTQMQQVFQNLISNAIKYNDKKKGLVRIGFNEEGHFWKFYVTDNGPGISEKYHDRIFKIFQVLEARDTRENTGVGLSIVKKIVEHSGGRVWVESQIEEGSTFYFTLRKRSD